MAALACPLRARLAALAAAALVLSAATATAVAAGTPVSARVAASTTVHVAGPSSAPAISSTQGFLGLASSFSTIPALGGSADDLDTPFINLVKDLAGGAAPLLRLGGNTGDDSWWPIASVRQSFPKVRYLYELTPAWAAKVKALLSAMGATAIMGVNLEEPPTVDAQIAPTEVTDFNQYIGANLINSFELGNEPEFMPPSYLTGHPTRGRATIAEYTHEYSHIASLLGDVSLAGPASVGPVFRSEIGQILAGMPAQVKLATVHIYGLSCTGKDKLTAADFFSPDAIAGLSAEVRQEVRASAAHGRPLQVDEMNGLACGGQAKVSNSFAEALWALNILADFWADGVHGVDWQSVYGALNQAITARHSSAGWRLEVEPVIYGLLAFAQAAPAGAHLLQISHSTSATTDQFATRASDGTERVVITNVGSGAAQRTVTVAGTSGTGTLALLTARSLSATGGATLGGQRLSPSTGRLAGRAQTTQVRRSAAGSYTVNIPAHSAAILTLATG